MDDTGFGFRQNAQFDEITAILNCLQETSASRPTSESFLSLEDNFQPPQDFAQELNVSSTPDIDLNFWKENLTDDSSDCFCGPINNANVALQPSNFHSVVDLPNATVNQIGCFQPENAETLLTVLEPLAPADSSFRQQSFESQGHVIRVPEAHGEEVDFFYEDSLQSVPGYLISSDDTTVYTGSDITTMYQPGNSEPENLFSISSSSSGMSRASKTYDRTSQGKSDSVNKPDVKSSGRRAKEKADKQEAQQKKKRQRIKKQLPKDSLEYRISRERNNVSVNKTREKRKRELESLISERDYYKSLLIENGIPFCFDSV